MLRRRGHENTLRKSLASRGVREDRRPAEAGLFSMGPAVQPTFRMYDVEAR